MGFAGGAASLGRGWIPHHMRFFEPRSDASCSVTAYQLDAGASCPALICAEQDLFSLLLIPGSSVRLEGVCKKPLLKHEKQEPLVEKLFVLKCQGFCVYLE